MKPIVFIKNCLANTDLAAGITIVILSLLAFLHLPPSFVLPLLLIVWVPLLLLKPDKKTIIIRFIRKHVTPIRLIAFFSLLLLIVFFIKFNFPTWNMVIFNDDYTWGYSVSTRCMETIKQGGMFGWDSQLLGGYCTVVDAAGNKSLFLLPFASVLGPAAGYHTMIFFFYLVFPCLCFWYTRIVFSDVKAGAIAFVFASIFLVSFFRNFMAFGMVDDLMGLDFFILNLILYEKVKSGSRYAAFFLCLSLFCTLYSHMGFLVFSVIYITLELIVSFSRKLLIQTILVFGLGALMTLHNVFTLFISRHFIFGDPDRFIAHKASLAEILQQTSTFFTNLVIAKKAFSANFQLESIVIALLPVFACLFLTGNRRVRILLLSVGIAILIQGVSPFPVFGIFAWRINYTLAFFYPVILSFFILHQFKAGRLGGIILAPLLFLPMVKTNTFYPFPHIPSIQKQAEPVYSTIKQLEGNMLWLESFSHLNVFFYSDSLRSEYPSMSGHWGSLLAMETGKRFLTNPQELWGMTGARDALINNGVFRGRPIGETPISEINETAKKWGVKYVIIWSKNSMAYFTNAPAFYTLRWAGFGFYIFEFLQADPRSVVVSQGQGFVTDHDYFGKTVSFTNVKAGDTAIIRQNYFPAWTYAYKGKNISVLNKNGQMAVIIPESGDLILNLNFPRYTMVTAIAFFALLISFLIFIAVPLIQKRRSKKSLPVDKIQAIGNQG
jgi:hypothetical protein